MRLIILKRYTSILILIVLLLIGCNNAKYTTVKHIKPVNRNRYFVRKKDKQKRRTRYVKVKILKESKAVKPAKVKPPKVKKAKEEETEDTEEDLEDPINESDSTGIYY